MLSQVTLVMKYSCLRVYREVTALSMLYDIRSDEQYYMHDIGFERVIHSYIEYISEWEPTI